MKFLLASLLGATAVWGQLLPPDCGKLAPGWEQSGPRRTYEGESLYEYMNGNSEGYLIYGFRKMTGLTCTKGGAKVLVDVSDMGDPEAAWGIFSANRDGRAAATVEPIGMGAQILPRKVIAAKGSYYLEIAAEPEGDHGDVLRQMMKTLAAGVEGRSAPPDIINWFPAAGLKGGAPPRLIPQSVLGMRILKRGYLAQYEDGSKAFIVPEASPQAAEETLAKVKARLGSDLETEGIPGAGDLGLVGKDKYLGRMALFRVGRYVAGWATVPPNADLLLLARTLAARIR